MARSTTRKTKFCGAYGKNHALEAIGKDKSSKDGLYRICKVADREVQRVSRERVAARKLAEAEAAAAVLAG